MKRIILLFSLFTLMSIISSCGSADIDYTLIKPDYQEAVSTGIENYYFLKQRESDACNHDYKAFGIQSPRFYQYDDSTHTLNCPLCDEVLEYVPHSEKLKSITKNFTVLKDGTSCEIAYSKCECGKWYKAVLSRGEAIES